MRVNKILLINPPGKCYVRKDGSSAERKHCAPPLGLAYLAANLLKHSYNVEVLDMLAEGYHNESYEEPFITYGLSIDDALKRIKEAQPDLIGVSMVMSTKARDCLKIIQAIKERLPNVLIVVGGQHPTGLPREFIKNPHIDFVLLGEADISLVKLADALNGRIPISDVPGLYYKEKGEIKDTVSHITPVVAGNGWAHFHRKDSPSPKKLEKLPYPAWQLFPMEAYWNSEVRIGGGDIPRERFAVMMTTRGCVWSCYFCATSLLSGYKLYRTRPIDDVIREIHWLIDTWKVDEIQFLDDNFFTNKRRTKELLKELAREFPDTVFSVPAGTEANSLDNEMIDLMKEANFHKVTIAVEAADPDIQNEHIDKKVRVDRVPQLIDYIRKKGMESRLLFMIGFPGEKREQIMRTIDLAFSLNADDFYISLVTPLPGTELYDECLKSNLLHEDFDINNIRFSISNIKLPDMTREEMEKLRRDVWLEYTKRKSSEKDKSDKIRFKKFKEIGEYETAGFKQLHPEDFRKSS